MTTWSGAMTEWLARLRFERRYSGHTLAAYASDLRVLAAFAQAAGITTPAGLTVDTARAFIAARTRAGHSGRSIGRALAAARGFYRHLAVRPNPFVGLRAPRSDRRLPGDLAVDQVQALFTAAVSDWMAIRDRAILELLYGSGLRLSELVALRLPELDLHEGLVRVRGKGGKERIVPVGAPAQQALRAWLSVRQSPQPLGSVFTSARGQALGARAVQKRLAVLGARCGLAAPLHPHALRHSFASHLLQSSGDLRAVQELLGHAHLSTTQVYTHLDFQQLARVYDAAHPRAHRRR
ncbi:MAG: tyrosine recombinase XerC [Acidiferrobacter sp.]